MESANETAVTTAPLLVKSQKETGWPARCAIPTATIFALAPTAVRLPPRTVPNSRAHHSTPEPVCVGIDAAMCATTGVIVAAYGTLLMKLPNVNDTVRISIVAVQASPWVR